MIRPPYLKPGDRIGIVATARKVNLEDLHTARSVFEEWGLIVVLSPYLFSTKHEYLAGEDVERLAGIQQMVNDPSIKAIVSARGGYGTTRILDQIDFTEFHKHPKWIVGFSDITALHLKMLAMGVQSVHGTMPILFGKHDSKESVESLKKALFGSAITIKAKQNSRNKPGIGEGRLIGGNLSLLVDALGSRNDPDTKNRILVLEEIDEYLYKVDRMIVQLKRAGKLDHLAGMVVGHFTDIKDSDLTFGESVEDIIRYHTRDAHFPIGFNFPVGHENPNIAWIEGATARLVVGEEKTSLNFDAGES